MSLKQLVEDTTAALMQVIDDYEFSEEQRRALRAVVEKSIAKAVEQARVAHKEATVFCCGPEADIAHKIEWEAKQKTNLLISNLSALR